MSVHDVGKWPKIHHENRAFTRLPKTDRRKTLPMFARTLIEILLGRLGALTPRLQEPRGISWRPRSRETPLGANRRKPSRKERPPRRRVCTIISCRTPLCSESDAQCILPFRLVAHARVHHSLRSALIFWNGLRCLTDGSVSEATGGCLVVEGARCLKYPFLSKPGRKQPISLDGG